ncbi:hypothetical protein CLOBOL_00561 [Enterocloster bolteae ATCC BAA-613]|uniref:Uncharacterized protein n=1 Tax=Enterocloster bolteae (strain ATCC BAA-613 / DSM 15670 / CCUG 46953 / JCM 12243 / WAL 16351) TaxID=411902 RepID=A8RI09_ENTBW|nr:hypothetical protein CLOBOL_00561 [Enterocloster bolteae ATCC BAA-613]
MGILCPGSSFQMIFFSLLYIIKAVFFKKGAHLCTK